MTRSPRVRNAALAAVMAQRGSNNLSLSKAAGTSCQCISAALNQRVEPKDETKAKIARALGVKVSDIFTAQVLR